MNGTKNSALDALGNQVRRDILSQLKEQDLNVQEISKRFAVSRPAISKHLRILEEAKLVKKNSSGTSNIYSLEVTGFTEANTYLNTFWDKALENFKHLAESSVRLKSNG